ncbi:M67 family metallopeptidase [Sphingomonas suaedae]|uniref:M67 family metallopeptidase n=1 Tax=Sphingomonas suaedae TaxID=2599297 RepID=A0A518RBJ6_9SPHN|nr:M67 family metallopeptidase [Sphingomonas suaedae]QDX24818.1 M67 family metallopeptidase [Sphingomonas suaedae]
MGLRISSCVIALIQQAAAEAAPLEACGLLFGDGAIARASVAANVAADPTCRFEIDPGALIAALRAEREGGERVIGYWHSHPSGDAMPSATDAAMAAPDGKLWLIAAGGAVTVWRAGTAGLHGRFERVMEIEVVSQFEF